MFDRLQKQWEQLKTSRPGHRFRDRYDRSRKSHNGPKFFWRIVRIAAAVALIGLGAVFMFIPGPAILFYFFAGALLATDSLPMAKLLDWTEVQARKIGSKARRFWRKLTPGGRIAVATLGLCLSVTGTLLFYRVVVN
ncbi:MAG: hypothetical protein C0518_13360 [Opitutus sp.]|nr:hypothetical protein [Opitutus sp.]